MHPDANTNQSTTFRPQMVEWTDVDERDWNDIWARFKRIHAFPNHMTTNTTGHSNEPSSTNRWDT